MSIWKEGAMDYPFTICFKIPALASKNMTKNSEDKSLTSLPRAFAAKVHGGGSDIIDAQLLGDICHTYRAPGQLARALLKQMPGDAPSPSADVFKILAERLPCQAFRHNWYSISDPPKKNLLPPLFHLVDVFIGIKTDERLGFQSETLKPLFEQRKGKIFPKLDSVPLLCDQLENVSIENPRWAALFAWSLIERTQWHFQNTIREKSLQDFPKVLRIELERRSMRELLDLLEPGNWLTIDRAPLSDACSNNVRVKQAEEHPAEIINTPLDMLDEGSKSAHDAEIETIAQSVSEIHVGTIAQGERLSEATLV